MYPARALVALAVLLPLLGCATAGPRFPSEVAISFAREPMRRARSENVELYYPASQREPAMAALARLDGCVAELRKLAGSRDPRTPALTYFTSSNFNNAYTYPPIAGQPAQIVLPTRMSLDMFNWFNLGLADMGSVGCHEAVHYVHAEQITGFWGVVDWLLGDAFTPNTVGVMESWFTEGVATYYEARLDKAVGRPSTPLWDALFEAGVAEDGGFRAGDLNAQTRRELPYGGSYLSGSHFVEWLVQTYGDDKLWLLIGVQANSIFSPLWISLRFKEVYGTTLDGLVAEYGRQLDQTLQRRARPEGQRVVVKDMGYLSRIGSAPDGTIVAVRSSFEDVNRLMAVAPDGRVLFSRLLTRILPGRPFIDSGALSVTGVSATGPLPGHPRGEIFVVLDDLEVDGTEMGNLLAFDLETGDFVRNWEGFVGVGGSVSADGKSYVLVDASDGRTNLARMDLESGKLARLTDFPAGTSIGAPALAPDGERIAFARYGADSFDLFLREKDGTLRQLTRDSAFDYFPRWLDDDRLVFVRTEGRRGQVDVLDVRSGEIARASDVPYFAFDPTPLPGGKVAFLNRDGWSWSLDEISLPAQATAAPPPAPEPTPPAPQAPAPSPPKLALLSDEPYTPGDGLLAPTLRGAIALPWIHQASGPVRLGLLAGAMLKGSDRLGMHNYAANVTYLSGERGPSADFTYGTALLAPWYLQASVSRAISTDVEVSQTTRLPEKKGDIIQTGASLDASRTFWTTPLALSLHGFQRQDTNFLNGRSATARFVGGEISTAYSAAASTIYGGPRLGLVMSADVSGYPEVLGSSFQMADLRGSIAGYLPLPILERQTFRLDVRGRWLPGAPPDLLQVGGIPFGVGLYGAGESRVNPPGYLLPGPISFVEALRGYEDHALFAKGALLAGARWRYPFIIDHGWPSTFYLLPSFFIRQVDLELFFDGALTSSMTMHRAAGAAIWLRTAFDEYLPISLVYQFAYRFDDGLPPLHQVVLAFQ